MVRITYNWVVLIIFLSFLPSVFSLGLSDCTQLIDLGVNEYADGTIQPDEVDCYKITLTGGMIPSGVSGNELIFYSELESTQALVYHGSSLKCTATPSGECRLPAQVGEYIVVISAVEAYSIRSWLKTGAGEVEKGEVVEEYVPPFTPGLTDVTMVEEQRMPDGSITYTYYNDSGQVLGTDLIPYDTDVDIDDLVAFKTQQLEMGFFGQLAGVNQAMCLSPPEDQLMCMAEEADMAPSGWLFELAKAVPIDRINYLSNMILAYDTSRLSEFNNWISSNETFNLSASAFIKDEMEVEKGKVLPYCDELVAISNNFTGEMTGGFSDLAFFYPGKAMSETTYYSAHQLPASWYGLNNYSKAIYTCSALKREFYNLKSVLISKTRATYSSGWNTPYEGFSYTDTAKIRANHNVLANGLNWVSDKLMSFGSSIIEYGEEKFRPEWSKDDSQFKTNWLSALGAIVPLPIFKEEKAYTGTRILGGALEGLGGLIRLPSMAGNAIGASLYYPSLYTEEDSLETASYFVEDMTIGFGASFVEDPGRVGGQVAGAWLGLKGLGKLGNLKGGTKVGGAGALTESEIQAWRAYTAMEQRLTQGSAAESSAAGTVMSSAEAQSWKAFNSMETRLASEAAEAQAWKAYTSLEQRLATETAETVAKQVFDPTEVFRVPKDNPWATMLKESTPEQISEALKQVEPKTRTGVTDTMHDHQPVVKIEVTKLRGHPTDNVPNLLKNADHQHQANPVNVIKVGEEYMIDDGVGRTTRAIWKGESTVNARVIREYASVEELMNAPGELAHFDRVWWTQRVELIDPVAKMKLLQDAALKSQMSTPAKTAAPVESAAGTLEDIIKRVDDEWHSKTVESHWENHRSEFTPEEAASSEAYAQLAIEVRYSPQAQVWNWEHYTGGAWKARIGYFDASRGILTIVDEATGKIVSSFKPSTPNYLSESATMRNVVRLK